MWLIYQNERSFLSSFYCSNTVIVWFSSFRLTSSPKMTRYAAPITIVYTSTKISCG